MKMKSGLLFLLAAALWIPRAASAAPDPNFYVFLCFGQSNMEGLRSSRPGTRRTWTAASRSWPQSISRT